MQPLIMTGRGIKYYTAIAMTHFFCFMAVLQLLKAMKK